MIYNSQKCCVIPHIFPHIMVYSETDDFTENPSLDVCQYAVLTLKILKTVLLDTHSTL